MYSILSVAILLYISCISCIYSQVDDIMTEVEDYRQSSIFKVNDDWLSLPEVFSKLDFNADNTFAVADDIAGQHKLRSSRYWGRLYLDGWPQSIQYFQAHFGDSPPIGKKKFIFSDPVEACSAIRNADIITTDHILLVHRGTCTYGSKALTIKTSCNASGIIIINNEAGLEHLPGPDAHDIVGVSVMSIAMDEGKLLEHYLLRQPALSGELTGYIVPINCDHHKSSCLPATIIEREYINQLSDGGHIHVHVDKLSHHHDHDHDDAVKMKKESIEYLLGYFGTKVPAHGQLFQLSTIKPIDACSNITSSSSSSSLNLTNMMIIVRRGGCDFHSKAHHIQQAGARGMILANNDPYLLRMGVEPRWKGLSINIPVVMVSKASYSMLVGESYAGSSISFEEAHEVSSREWAALEKLYKDDDDDGWPSTASSITDRYDELKAYYHQYVDRLKTLDYAYNMKLKKLDPITDTLSNDEL